MLRFVQRSSECRRFDCPEGMPQILHELLLQRGVTSAEEAHAFLHPSEDQLLDPFLLSDMDLAVQRIRKALDSGEHICVYGDYDVDGVCASSILATYFADLGADFEVYLPSRHDEGYGLNEAAIRKLAETTNLMVTVDCGITSHDLVELAKSLGMDCIITDHHRPGEVLPECPVVNPQLKEYPFSFLCGAGVAFKLVWALGGRDAAMARIDLAAIATVADIVTLTKENRVIVHLGLQAINMHPRTGVRALMGAAHLEPGQVTSESIAFRLAPRLNAGGRLGSARRSFDLLTQEDPFLATAEADSLEQENGRRQAIESEVRAEAEQQLAELDFSAHRILLIRGKGWNSGVIGLAASHLREKYNYPVIVFSESDGQLVGSCRSIDDVDIFKTLSSAAHLMVKFGGHAQAAGLTILPEDFDALWKALDDYLFANTNPESYLPRAQYDLCAALKDFNEPFVHMLGALEPTGCGNPEPIFRTEVDLAEARAIGTHGTHLRIVAAQDGVRRTGIYFGAGALAETVGDTAEILFTPQINVWNGRTSVQLHLSALRESDFSSRIAITKKNEVSYQRAFLTELVYNGVHHPSEASEIGLDDLVRRLASSPQGTWILCGSTETAQKILAKASALPLDLVIGKMSGDVRAFNCLMICPDHLETIPRGVRTVVFAGIPAFAIDGKELLTLRDAAIPFEFPDLDQMRAVYRVCRQMIREPIHMANMGELTQRLSEESGLPQTVCLLSVLAMADMQLIELHARPFKPVLLPAQKTDPNASRVWCSIQAFKQRIEGRD